MAVITYEPHEHFFQCNQISKKDLKEGKNLKKNNSIFSCHVLPEFFLVS